MYVHELLLSPPYRHLLPIKPLVPLSQKQERLQSSQATATSLTLGTPEKALQISVHLPTVRAFCFGSARAEFKLCLELNDPALGAKVYSWRRD